MSASIRLLALSVTVVLLVASCGQKGPLRLPEDDATRSAPVRPAD
jgi:predicted small lipoprotein YifL